MLGSWEARKLAPTAQLDLHACQSIAVQQVASFWALPGWWHVVRRLLELPPPEVDALGRPSWPVTASEVRSASCRLLRQPGVPFPGLNCQQASASLLILL